MYKIDRRGWGGRVQKSFTRNIPIELLVDLKYSILEHYSKLLKP